jgi:hypothetical protein
VCTPGLSVRASPPHRHICRKRIDGEFPEDIPTVYKPFSVATLREAVRRLLAT